MRLLLLFFPLLLDITPFSPEAMDGDYYPMETPKRVYVLSDGDTIPHIVLQPIFCFPKKKFRNERAEQRYYQKYYQEYYRTIYNLKKVYPFAQIVKKKLMAMEEDFVNLQTERERKLYIKKVEKEVFAEFEPQVRKMTISQGKILIKLINRETGKTGYTLIKEMKGSLSAFFWQTIAVMFSSSLKTEFDAKEKDKMLNEIIVLYESGML